MSETLPSPPRTPRTFKRVPSGPRPAPLPLRGSPTSSRVTSTASIPQSLRNQQSFSSLSRVAAVESPLDALINLEVDFTASPEESPTLQPQSDPIARQNVQASPPVRQQTQQQQQPAQKPHGPTQIFTGLPMIRDGSRGSAQGRSQTTPDNARPSTPTSFVVARPTTPSGFVSPPSQKAKPKPSRLNTSNLGAGSTSPTKAISPGLRHWQNVRQHVMAPTPVEERAAQHVGRTGGKKHGIVSKAAGRFGFRQAADHVIGFEERRRSMTAMMSDLNGLSVEQQEEIARERRKFARDVKACLDACALEESRRRLWRIGRGGDSRSLPAETKSSATSVHASMHTAQRFTFDPDFSAFAPLLTELHKHLPAARAKKPWSRTCPHHSAILAELGVAFLRNSISTDGEKQQALEVFGVIVKNWAADSADEELDRWLWLCRALLTGDRHLRNRGLTLLCSFLHSDPALPGSPYRPNTALAFVALASALISLLHAVETTGDSNEVHRHTVEDLCRSLLEGDVINVDEASLVDLLGSLELTGSTGGVGKELFWMALADTAGIASLVSWLLSDDSSVLRNFRPSPIMHPTQPIILALRSRSTAVFFSSWSSLIRLSDDTLTSAEIWRAAQTLLLDVIEHLPDDDDGTLAIQLGSFLLELEIQCHRLTDSSAEANVDPFRISLGQKQASAGDCEHRKYLARICVEDTPLRRGLYAAAKQIVRTSPLSGVCAMIRSFLQSESFLALGKECVSSLYLRYTSSSGPFDESRPFLAWLSKAHPQLLYKPLFSLSASTQLAALSPHLKLVAALSELIGPSKFWTHTDPQMIVIVLMGDVAPRQSKGKGKEGERVAIAVKLGRYAVLVEMIAALEQVDESAGSGTRLRAFVEAIESRLTAFLEAEEKEGVLPDLYKSLICKLLLRLRLITMSVRRSPWMRLVLTWFADVARTSASNEESTGQLSLLQTVYHASTNTADVARTTKSATTISPSFSRTNTARAGGTLLSLPHNEKRTILDTPLAEVMPALLVAAHTSITLDVWSTLLPLAWRRYEPTQPSLKALAFLLEKCAEVIPGQLQAIIFSDLTSTHPFIRCQALSKVAMLFGWRYQVLAQRIITDRRGPVFQFMSRTLEFVTTEIGSSNWVPPPDVQDAALQKFGPTLPLELRQRLMELGWSKDSTLQSKSDWEQIPISSLPSLQYQQEGMQTERSPSPMRSLMRRGSSGSGSSLSSKRRKAIFAPILLGIAAEQATILLKEVDGSVDTLSRELTLLVQRDDHVGALRPITEGFADDILYAIARLNAVATTLTPTFAYAALNAIVGYLKNHLRNNPDVEHYSAALTTIAQLLPSVSEMSLRDIRKNKAEHVLLPASIHEDESGFKVHAPWRDARLSVQTSQLLILAEILKSNPREVYLVKKMLSNLQVQGSIHHLSFARAWLICIATLFSAVNRNYNDRAELRHFLSKVCAILRLHGTHDILIVAHAMRVFILCSARFRRLFTSMGFSTIMRPIYETHAVGNPAVRDCIEYAIRSFYRIHQDTFVYQTCVVISEGEYAASAVYALLACLSIPNTAISGVSSGIKGLNDQEEIEALVQMISGPELALSEIGQAAADRQASKLASISLDEQTFPKENIVKLFFTVIAANPATSRAANFLRLLAVIVPEINDATSKELLREGVEALGLVIYKGKTGDEAAILAFHPGSDDKTPDWTAARRNYVFLVESYAHAGGQMGASATRRTLELVLDLLKRQPESVGPAASSILRELARTHLSSSKPTPFLKEIAPLFRMFIAVVDFSGVLDSITSLIRRSHFELDDETTRIIIDEYVEPSVRMLASASEESMVFIVPLRSSAVKLLGAAVFLKGGDALAALERHPPTASLLASLVLPLCLLLEVPLDVDRGEIYSSLWIRLLHYVLRPPLRRRHRPTSSLSSSVLKPSSASQSNLAAAGLLVIQVIKIIITRSPEAISQISGLWNYLSHKILRTIGSADGRFASAPPGPGGAIQPRLVDWIMWTFFELLALHRSPLMIHLRCRIQLALQAVQEGDRSRPPSPSPSPTPSPGLGGKFSFPPSNTPQLGGRARVSSSRSPSMAYHARVPSGTTPELLGGGGGGGHSRFPSANYGPQLTLTPAPNPVLAPGQGHVRHASRASVSHARMPSQHLTPFLGTSRSPSGSYQPGHGRFPSQSSISGALGVGTTTGGGRPSFADLSARRASRPAFEAFSLASNPRPPSPHPHLPSFTSAPTPKIGGLAPPKYAGAGVNFRFPSSAGVRSLGQGAGDKAGGAIIHLLTAPTQVLSAHGNGGTTSPTSPVVSPFGNPFRNDGPASDSTDGAAGTAGKGLGGVVGDAGVRALAEMRVKDGRLARMARRAVRTVQLVEGYEVSQPSEPGLEGEEEEEEVVKTWSVHDALHVIAEQTRLIVEDEFREVFSPPAPSSLSDPRSHPHSRSRPSYPSKESKGEWKEIEKDLEGYTLSPPLDISDPLHPQSPAGADAGGAPIPSGQRPQHQHQHQHQHQQSFDLEKNASAFGFRLSPSPSAGRRERDPFAFETYGQGPRDTSEGQGRGQGQGQGQEMGLPVFSISSA